MAHGDVRETDKLPGFGIKDSGARAEFDSGMVRDVEDDKIDWTLVFDGPMLKRYAEHLTKGAKKYSPRNWMKASGDAEYERFKRSLLRHLVAYLNGETDEDHAAAVIFNLNGMEYVLSQRPKDPGHKQPHVGIIYQGGMSGIGAPPDFGRSSA